MLEGERDIYMDRYRESERELRPKGALWLRRLSANDIFISFHNSGLNAGKRQKCIMNYDELAVAIRKEPPDPTKSNNKTVAVQQKPIINLIRT